MQPHPNIIKKIEDGSFPLSDNTAYKESLSLLNQEFERTVEFLNKKLPTNNMRPNDKAMYLFNVLAGVAKDIERNERPHTEMLQDLGVETIRELYNVPEDIAMRGLIKPKVDLDASCCDAPEELNIDPDRLPVIEAEINKRIICNGLVHGSSVNLYKSLHHMTREKLNTINKRLNEYYDQYAAAINFLNFQFDPDMMNMALQKNNQLNQGKCEIDFKAKEVQAESINFPVLLHELNKGVFEYIVAKGLPRHLSIDEMKYMYREADRYSLEVWHYWISTSHWVNLLEACDSDSTELPKIVSKLSQLTYKQLSNIFEEQAKMKRELKFYKIIS